MFFFRSVHTSRNGFLLPITELAVLADSVNGMHLNTPLPATGFGSQKYLKHLACKYSACSGAGRSPKLSPGIILYFDFMSLQYDLVSCAVHPHSKKSKHTEHARTETLAEEMIIALTIKYLGNDWSVSSLLPFNKIILEYVKLLLSFAIYNFGYDYAIYTIINKILN